MPATLITPRTQILVLVALLLLTGATVAISFLEIPAQWHLASGLGIAVLKASLVALFFMHVIHSRAATWSVVTVAVFWLVAILIGLTLSDYMMRGATPFAPGH
jgi:cytochrome c oxidase subunit 4